jgi:hypothetical protein
VRPPRADTLVCPYKPYIGARGDDFLPAGGSKILVIGIKGIHGAR